MGCHGEGKTCLLEAAATAGWLARGPQMPGSISELLDSAWDEYERRLQGRESVSGGSTRQIDWLVRWLVYY